MAKGKTSIFFCQECGYESSKWSGQCPACKAWNTFVEEKVDKKTTVSRKEIAQVKPTKINEMKRESAQECRNSTGCWEGALCQALWFW